MCSPNGPFFPPPSPQHMHQSVHQLFFDMKRLGALDLVLLGGRMKAESGGHIHVVCHICERRSKTVGGHTTRGNENDLLIYEMTGRMILCGASSALFSSSKSRVSISR